MAYLTQLQLYQAKILTTAGAVVELDRTIASVQDFAQREQLQRHADSQRAMLRAFEGMVAFLNCCIEIERRETSPSKDESRRTKLA